MPHFPLFLHDLEWFSLSIVSCVEFMICSIFSKELKLEAAYIFYYLFYYILLCYSIELFV